MDNETRERIEKDAAICFGDNQTKNGTHASMKRKGYISGATAEHSRITELLNPKQKKLDVFIRVLIALIVAVVGFFIANKPIVDGFILSLAIHFFFFDYAIVYILQKRGVIESKQSWFEYLGQSYTDDVLRQWSPKTRFFIKLGILSGSLIVYFL